ncbi:hypothetical protein [Microbulbifer sp. TRSA005]|uniref:hypothetical protein n=1 Tax=Microbulbifer sp. TRSA005 TaxID=3243383 RepID=UPI0040394A17
MDLTDENLRVLLDNKLVIDCPKIKLIQQTDNDPLIYSGPGSIIQQPDGNLQLKLYHVGSENPFGLLERELCIEPGLIIGREYFFSMEAEDIKGGVWTSEYLGVRNADGVSNLRTGAAVYNVKINSLSFIEKLHEGQGGNSKYLLMVLPGKQAIPCNRYEEISGVKHSLNTSAFKALGADVSIKSKESYLVVEVNDEGGVMDESFQPRLLEALNIAFGRSCQVLYSLYVAEGQRTVVLKSVLRSTQESRVESAVPHIHPNHQESFANFISMYMVRFRSCHDVFYGYWHKIYSAWQSANLEIHSLALCTCIEGITKHYFSSYGTPEEGLVKEADNAKEAIKQAKIGDKIKNRLLSNLGSVQKPNPKNALYNLAKEQVLDKVMVDSWVKLRNKSAHADKLGEHQEEIQKHLNHLWKCLSLFYILLLSEIHFAGLFQDLSKTGWPIRNFGEPSEGAALEKVEEN